MPPRLSGVRATGVGSGRGGRPKPMTPGNAKAANFKAVRSQIAKRQKVSQDRADEIVRGA